MTSRPGSTATSRRSRRTGWRCRRSGGYRRAFLRGRWRTQATSDELWMPSERVEIERCGTGSSTAASEPDDCAGTSTLGRTLLRLQASQRRRPVTGALLGPAGSTAAREWARRAPPRRSPFHELDMAAHAVSLRPHGRGCGCGSATSSFAGERASGGAAPEIDDAQASLSVSVDGRRIELASARCEGDRLVRFDQHSNEEDG